MNEVELFHWKKLLLISIHLREQFSLQQFLLILWALFVTDAILDFLLTFVPEYSESIRNRSTARCDTFVVKCTAGVLCAQTFQRFKTRNICVSKDYRLTLYKLSFRRRGYVGYFWCRTDRVSHGLIMLLEYFRLSSRYTLQMVSYIAACL